MASQADTPTALLACHAPDGARYRPTQLSMQCTDRGSLEECAAGSGGSSPLGAGMPLCGDPAGSIRAARAYKHQETCLPPRPLLRGFLSRPDGSQGTRADSAVDRMVEDSII